MKLFSTSQNDLNENWAALCISNCTVCSNNTFKRDNPRNRNPPKNNSRFDSLDNKKSGNRFASKRRTNGRFNRNRDTSYNSVPNMGKFTQVGTGEVSFAPQHKTKKKKEAKNLG